MNDKRDEPEVIEYIPKPKSAVNWKIATPLIVGWIGILLAAMILKIGMLKLIWPVFMAALVIYLVFCTVAAITRK